MQEEKDSTGNDYSDDLEYSSNEEHEYSLAGTGKVVCYIRLSAELN